MNAHRPHAVAWPGRRGIGNGAASATPGCRATGSPCAKVAHAYADQAINGEAHRQITGPERLLFEMLEEATATPGMAALNHLRWTVADDNSVTLTDPVSGQSHVLRPKIIVCLGRIAAMRIIKPDFKITREHGQWFEKSGIQMMAVYHPAALLRDPRRRPETFEDFKSLQQKINELELKINREKQKLDKKLTRQKILLGAFLIDALENDSVDGLKEYTADNLLDFLSRQGDKDLMADLVKGLKAIES